MTILDGRPLVPLDKVGMAWMVACQASKLTSVDMHAWVGQCENCGEPLLAMGDNAPSKCSYCEADVELTPLWTYLGRGRWRTEPNSALKCLDCTAESAPGADSH